MITRRFFLGMTLATLTSAATGCNYNVDLPPRNRNKELDTVLEEAHVLWRNTDKHLEHFTRACMISGTMLFDTTLDHMVETFQGLFTHESEQEFKSKLISPRERARAYMMLNTISSESNNSDALKTMNEIFPIVWSELKHYAIAPHLLDESAALVSGALMNGFSPKGPLSIYEAVKMWHDVSLPFLAYEESGWSVLASTYRSKTIEEWNTRLDQFPKSSGEKSLLALCDAPPSTVLEHYNSLPSYLTPTVRAGLVAIHMIWKQPLSEVELAYTHFNRALFEEHAGVMQAAGVAKRMYDLDQKWASIYASSKNS